MKKIGLKLKMFFFKLNYFATLFFFRPKIIFQDRRTKKEIRCHKSPFIVAHNHIGYYDALLLWGVFIGKYVRFIATDQILRNFMCRFFFGWNGVITISRGNINLSAYSEIRKSLDAGFWVGISPEGHIDRTTELANFHHGAAQIAIASRTDLLPVYVAPKRKLFWQRQMVYIGNYFAPNGDKKQLTDLLKDRIIELAQAHKKRMINAFLKNKSRLYILPFIDDIKENEVKTTFYKKYDAETNQYALSKCAWYFLEKIFLKFGVSLADGDISFSESGKPIHKDICFNISHDKQMIAIILDGSDCSTDCQAEGVNPPQTEEWVRCECKRKLLDGIARTYLQKQINYNAQTYVVGAMSDKDTVIRQRI